MNIFSTRNRALSHRSLSLDLECLRMIDDALRHEPLPKPVIDEWFFAGEVCHGNSMLCCVMLYIVNGCCFMLFWYVLVFKKTRSISSRPIKFGPLLRPSAMHARHSPSSSQSTRSPMSMRSAPQHKADAEPPAAPEEWDSPRDVHGEGNVSQAVSLFQHWFRSCRTYLADSRD